MEDLYKIKNLSKAYEKKVILSNINFLIKKGAFTVIIGESGSGKSTLLNILGMLETYDSGSIMMNNKSLPKPFSSDSRYILKNEVGYLFQNFALVEDRDVRYNLKMVTPKISKSKETELLNNALEAVGLSNFLDKKIASCSGGEQQRVAIARLLLKDSKIILCDEPTGSLDEDNCQKVMDLLSHLHKQGKTVIVVTHDRRFIELATQVITIDKIS